MPITRNELPANFIKRMEAQLGPASTDFLDALAQPRITSIRLNAHKPSHRFAQEQPVGWCAEARYLAERPQFAKDPLIFGGGYYVQEASSMFIAHAFRKLIGSEAENMRALDLCAAPGGKSTLMSSLLPANSFLISNELVSKRVPALMENILRWGLPNVAVSNNSAEDFSPLSNYFDWVVVDAPCSGEGMFRKDPKTAEQWSEGLVASCANIQRQILTQIAPTVKPDGWLFYSTCTYSHQENEDQVAWLIENEGFECAKLPLQPEWGIVECEIPLSGNGLAYGYRFYPHLAQGEGFFFAALRKIAGGRPAKPRASKKDIKLFPLPRKQQPILHAWLTEPLDIFMRGADIVQAMPALMAEDAPALSGMLHIRQMGVELGRFNRDQLIPAHALALSTVLATSIPKLELSWEQAIAYLQKKELQADGQNITGWAVATYEGVGLGWVKVLPNRINSFFPTEYRLRKEFDMEDGFDGGEE